MAKTIAAYGGGFKPPTAGHFEVVQKSLKDFPEIDEFIIYVGGGERNGINQAQSILIWEIYQTYLPMKVRIEPSKAPIGDVVRLGKNNPQDTVYFIIGGREGRDDDAQDIESRTKNIEEKYPNMKIKIITTPDSNMSGTNARKAAKVSPEEFYKYIPTELNDSEKEEVYNIVKPTINEVLNENASYSSDIDYKSHIKELTKYMVKDGWNITPLPKVIFKNGDSENARNFFGKTAYYDPNTKTIVLYTEGRHPKDIVRSFSHEMVHHEQNLDGRLGDITTTNTQEDDRLNDIEKEANLNGTMTFRNWTDSLNEAIVGDKIECDGCGWSWNIKDGGDDLFLCHKCGHDNTPITEKKEKDPFGLKQYARELAQGLEEKMISEGAYDSLVTKLSRLTIDQWKKDLAKNPKVKQSWVDIDIDEEDGKGRPIEFNYVGMVKFDKKVDGYEIDGTSNSGEEEDKIPFIATLFTINPEILPQAWSQIITNVKDVIRHEIEHLTQSGDNVRSGKYLEDDIILRDMINKLKLLPKSDYYKLDKEVDAMLQGLYFKAKKSKKPFADVINNYLDVAPGIDTPEDKEIILNLWRSRRKALSLPVFEQNKEVMKYEIYSDMDGVITDFDASFMKASDGIRPAEYEKNFGKDGFWELIDGKGVGFWVGMPWMSDGKQYWDYIKEYTPILLSSPSRSNTSRLGKRLWVRNNLPGTKLILAQAKDKQNYAQKNRILIDDRPSNIEQWRSQGGVGILHTSAADTIKQLKALGL